jgi:hypothetical protein
MRPADVHKYVDEVAGAGATTLFVCPNYGMAMLYPSKVAEMIGTGVSPAEDPRIERVARERPLTVERAIVNCRALVTAGHDPLGVVIDRARARRLEVFITFRLNEVHNVDTPDDPSARLILSRYWREHADQRIGRAGDELPPLYRDILGPQAAPVVRNWLPAGLDFARPEVRQRRLAELRECCERYPIDGLDLDFQRFPMYFRPGSEGANTATMTDFVRAARAMTREVGRHRGRPLLLSARVMARPAQSRGVGLDPAAWAREGLVDFLVVSHCLHNDFPLPVGDYRKMVPADLPLYASIDMEREGAAYRRLARQLRDAGADGLLFFNFFNARAEGKEPDFVLLRDLMTSH